MRLRTTAALVTAACLMPIVGHAQSAQRWSAQVSALYASLSGDAFKSFNAGGGVEGQGRYTMRNGFSFGAGWQYTTHKINGLANNATLQGPFIEPRYTFVVGDNESFFPYASARAAFLEQSLSDAGFTATSSGQTYGAGGGVLIRVASRLNLDLGATAGYTSFGDASFNGQKFTGYPTGSGTNFILRAGLAYGLK